MPFAKCTYSANLQANLLLGGVWWVKPVDSNLYVNIHCYLLLTLASYYVTMIKIPENEWEKIVLQENVW